MRGLRARSPAALTLFLSAAPGWAPAQDDSTGTTEVTPELLRSVERGLEYLAAQQQPDGSWLGDVGYKLNTDYAVVLEARPHLGVTALACMSFMAGGNVPGRGRYGECILKGLDWILSSVTESGYVRANESRMYDHAFATLFLAEIYGMTHRDDVGAKLQRAVDLTIKSQNAEGGWRYEPFAPDSDMSITVCQVMALRAARNIGIRVPKITIDKAVKYVRDSAVRETRLVNLGEFDERGSFRYQKLQNSRSSWPLTAAGLVTLHGAGVYSDRDIDEGLDYLIREQERFSRHWGDLQRGHYFFWYGHYYAVQAMYIAGGDRFWQTYFDRIRALLLLLQREDGSWENREGPGPNFSTAVATLILQIPYRYLPIFQR